MRNFEYYTPTQVLFGKDTHLQAGSLLKKYGAKKVLIHYGGQSAVRSGLIDEITSNLKKKVLNTSPWVVSFLIHFFPKSARESNYAKKNM